MDTENNDTATTSDKLDVIIDLLADALFQLYELNDNRPDLARRREEHRRRIRDLQPLTYKDSDIPF